MYLNHLATVYFGIFMKKLNSFFFTTRIEFSRFIFSPSFKLGQNIRSYQMFREIHPQVWPGRWYRQMVQTDGTDRWYRQMVQTDGTDRWYRQMVQTDDTDRWYRQMVQTDGTDRWYRQTVQRDRQTDRETDRQTGRQTDRETDRQGDRQTERHQPLFDQIGNISHNYHLYNVQHCYWLMGGCLSESAMEDRATKWRKIVPEQLPWLATLHPTIWSPQQCQLSQLLVQDLKRGHSMGGCSQGERERGSAREGRRIK